MKITIESTNEFTSVNTPGIATVKARIWNGVTEKGIECKVLVTGIAVQNMKDTSEFEAELAETAIPEGLRLGPGYDKK